LIVVLVLPERRGRCGGAEAAAAPDQPESVAFLAGRRPRDERFPQWHQQPVPAWFRWAHIRCAGRAL